MGSSVMLETSGGDKSSKKRSKKKRRAPEPEISVADKTINTDDGVAVGVIDFDENEPTMAEKLANLDIVNKDDTEHMELELCQEPTPAQPPSADSVHILLKQALLADDRALLLNCLYNQDQKVITNSVAVLSPLDIFKLFQALLSITQSRGAILVCALPWLKSLVLQHASRIAAHESSLVALNSLYQLIESRATTLQPGIELASSLDTLFVGIIDDGIEEQETVPPVIYEDYDDSDEASEEAMETDEEADEVEGSSVVSDAELSDEDTDS